MANSLSNMHCFGLPNCKTICHGRPVITMIFVWFMSWLLHVGCWLVVMLRSKRSRLASYVASLFLFSALLTSEIAGRGEPHGGQTGFWWPFKSFPPFKFRANIPQNCLCRASPTDVCNGRRRKTAAFSLPLFSSLTNHHPSYESTTSSLLLLLLSLHFVNRSIKQYVL